MASSYPGALDNLSAGGLTHGDISDAVAALEETVGVNPLQVVSGPTNTLTRVGLWIQTGLGSSGTDFTIWFEDGT